MDNSLFQQFCREVDDFVSLGQAASHRQSQYGLENNEPTKNQEARWLELVEDVNQSNIKIKMLYPDIENNKEAINLELETFRELSRRMDYCHCFWSAYFKQIDKALDKIYILRRDIDRKYKLGQHKNDP